MTPTGEEERPRDVRCVRRCPRDVRCARGALLRSGPAWRELRRPPRLAGPGHLCRLCVRHVEGSRRRLSELVLRGMTSEVLSCRVSSTAVCVEVRRAAWRAGQAAELRGGSSLLPRGLPQGALRDI